ncbi:bifunctional heparan sulfate n-deacetylase/n-sulfotransferase [Plakobranchus ocellatus]|uniref:[heparan sulfate]-glucosamine N-sulfotransferase n=1 Tax=Plakobranchus ocellatus TaxID=259542 RepID=A0AAV4BC57_9GAST|nr:bifunctional heparan sulfate n-deacetylase/n-sulfotransferase [Plakobranchus ocellatus]
MPRPATMKRWSNTKVASVGILLCLMVVALNRMEKERRAYAGANIVVDHRSLVSKRFEDFEAGGVNAVRQEQQNRSTILQRVFVANAQDKLVTDSAPVAVAGPTGARVFTPPKRNPANERALPSEVLSQYFPLEIYFHKYLPEQSPKSTPVKTVLNLDTKLPLKTALVVLELVKASTKKPMEDFFGAQRIQIEFAEAASIPPLVIKSLQVARYSLIVFANHEVYLGLDKVQKSKIDEYCQAYGVGILSFTDSSKIGEQELSSEYKIKMQHRMKLTGMKLNSEVKDLWRIAKPEKVFKDPLPNDNSEWTVFLCDHPSYQSLAFSTVAPGWKGSVEGINKAEFGLVVAVRDTGLIDGIHRIILGNDPEFFLNFIIAMDGLAFLSHGRLALPMERMVQVDVDDMFVGVSTVRTKPKDAEAMVECNKRIRQYVPNFKLFLGFTGAMFLWGGDDADEGERMMIDYAQEFIWFNHLYRHELLYITPTDRISGAMSKNAVFGKEKNLPVVKEYMILPHHAGVYPVYPEVFDEWEKLGYIKATSTLEYPYRHPQWGRRGFIHRGVMVLPRQTCRLFTKTISFDAYEGGKKAMDESLNGGYMFKIFLTTPIMVFMTHMSNYATGQLAQYEFEGVTKAIATWTNLKMVAPHPIDLANEYFEFYPDEVSPLWSDPARDPNLKELWRVNKTLPVFPKVLIAGPQKTGTTALMTFLLLHPNLVTSKPDPSLYEEVQFFSSNLYDNGIDWYASRFPEKKNDQTVLFEKSANYFSHHRTPQRVKELMPDAKIIIIMNNPSRRAYSWYQHLKAHNDSLVQQYTFYQIITADDQAPETLKIAHKRHLHDGIYAVHLSRWLLHFPKEQLYLVDGEKLIQDPVSVMNDVQKFIGVTPKIDYKTKIQFDTEKGFFCAKTTGCLGSGKGRSYEKMDKASEAYLREFYKHHNEDLKTLLDSIEHPHPLWLQQTENSQAPS